MSRELLLDVSQDLGVSAGGVEVLDRPDERLLADGLETN